MTETAREKSRSRRMINGINGVIKALQRVGIVFGPMQVLTVTGRKSGLPRELPVAIVPVGGQRYLFQAYPKAGWVANVRAAGEGTLARGRKKGPVKFVELTPEERAPVLRELVATHRGTGERFTRNGMCASPAPDDVAAAAPKIAVFRVEPLG